MPRHTRPRRSPSTPPFVAVVHPPDATAQILTVQVNACEYPTLIVLECDGPPELLATVRVRRFEMLWAPPD